MGYHHLPSGPVHPRPTADPTSDGNLDRDSDLADAAWLYAWAREALCPGDETQPAILIVPG